MRSLPPMSRAYLDSLVERLLKKVVVMPTGCWEWQGHGVRNYGMIRVLNSMYLVHRVTYELYKVISPGDLLVCHSCDNPKCCNPDHLWLGTDRDNSRGMIAKRRNVSQNKTHCPQGHEYTPENTIYTSWKNSTPRRVCRSCRKIVDDNYNKKRKHKQRKIGSV